MATVGEVLSRESSFTLDVPFHKQENPLTCETAALRMVLNYYQAGLSEDELLEKLSFDVREPMTPEGVWGDPDKGFVGRVDGSVFHGTGYGVFDAPIRNLARQFKGAVELQDPNVEKIVGLVQGGKPVIVWGLLSNRPPIYWQTAAGKTVEAHPGEHARVVIGFTGESHDPKKLILLDPIYGRIHMGVDEFVRDWEVMKKRTVVVH